MNDLDAVLSRGLRDRSALGLTRHLQRTEKPVVDMGSNDYLGLANEPSVVAAAERATREYGAGSTGARLISGNLPIHEKLEAAIAKLKGTDAALLFPSGYQAAVGTIPSLVESRDLILSDELNHACLIDGCRLSRATVKVYRHSDLDYLEELLQERRSYRRCLIVTDGVFSMDGDVADLAALTSLCERYDAWLMVDDAHGTGVLGETGAGTAQHYGVSHKVSIQMGTLSKALGSSGGFIAGTQVLIDHLVNNARSFVFTTGPTPAASGAALESVRIVASQPERRRQLRENAAYIRRGLRSLGVTIDNSDTPIIPVVVGNASLAVAIAAELRPVYGIAAVRPPTVPENSSRLRVTVKATHTTAELDDVVTAFDTVFRRYGMRQFVLDGFEK